MNINTKITLIYCDSRRRDSTVAILLQEFLRKRKQISFISSRRNFSKILKLATPENIIVIGQLNIVFDLIYDGKKLKERFKNTNIYFYPSEGYATENEYHQMYPERFSYAEIKKIFFWGKESLNWVQSNLQINPTVLDNTGYPRLKMAKIYSQMGSAEGAKKIGIVGRFAMLNDLYGILPMEYLISEFATAGDYKGVMLTRLRVETEAISTILKTIGFIIKNTDYSISFRPHPNEDPASYSRLRERYGHRIEISDEVDVSDWLSSCTKIIGLASSSYIDAGLTQVPIICLDAVSGVVDQTLAYEPALRLIYDIAYLPSNFEELTRYIQDDIEAKTSPTFEELIASNFVGNYEDPIKHVANSIHVSAGGWTASLMQLFIEAADFLLVAHDRIRKNTALDFEYSSAVHGRNSEFIRKYLGDK
jgi:surface carbohydrate biosynthesis protein